MNQYRTPTKIVVHTILSFAMIGLGIGLDWRTDFIILGNMNALFCLLLLKIDQGFWQHLEIEKLKTEIKLEEISRNENKSRIR